MVTPTRSPQRKPPGSLTAFVLVIAALFVTFLLHKGPSFLEFRDGKAELSKERQAKLQKELDELENAQQYVLLASRAGYYDCFNCGAKTTIFLEKGHVWKYGVTRKGEKIRYGDWHVQRGLYYIIEYEGPIQKCLRREKIQIYNYATLPENLQRPAPLIRPPGNKRDD